MEKVVIIKEYDFEMALSMLEQSMRMLKNVRVSKKERDVAVSYIKYAVERLTKIEE
jgi:hypothetical protein